MSASASTDSIRNVELGLEVTIFPGAILGKPPSAPAGLLARPIHPTGQPARVGDKTVIGCHAVIYEGVVIGKNCLIGDGAIVREGTTIGDGCIIGMHVVIGYNVSIGSESRIQEGSQIVGLSRLGSHVFVGPRVCSSNDPSMGRRKVLLRGIVVEDWARIGVGAVFLPGVTVGADAVVGAGAVVTRDIPPGMVAFGCPARVIRSISAEETARCSP